MGGALARGAAIAALALTVTAGTAAAVDPVPTKVRPVWVGADAVPARTLVRWQRVFSFRAGHPRTFHGVPERRAAAAFLINYRWLDAEARERGITVTPAQARAWVDEQRAKAYPSRRAFAKFLRSRGETLADLRVEARAGLLQTRILDAVHASAASPEDAAAQTAGFPAYLTGKWAPRTQCLKTYFVKAVCGAPATR